LKTSPSDATPLITARLSAGVAVALACSLATLYTSAAVPGQPWLALAAAGGLGLAAFLRWGVGHAVALGAGVTSAFLATASPTGQFLALLVLIGSLLLAAQVLRNTSFDARLERARDVGWLAAAVLLIAAPLAVVSTLVAAGGAGGGLPWLEQFAQAWAGAGMAMLVTALPMLMLDARMRDALDSPVTLLAVVSLTLTVMAATAASVWLGRGQPATWALLSFAPQLLLLVLVLRHGGAFASLALLLAVALGIWTAPADALLGGVLGSMLALLLIAVGAAAEARWREHRWEWALDGSRLGVADWHLRRKESFASDVWAVLAGSTATPWSPSLWLSQVHRDDRLTLEQAIAQVATGEVGRVSLELRMPREGGWRWLEATLLVIEREPDGRPGRALATLADVDERRDAQERQRLSVSLFQHLNEGLLITDADLRVLDANPAYSEILGVPRDELLGHVPPLLRPAPADPLARQQRAAMWAALSATGSWRGELIERRRNGEPCTLQTTISTVLGPAGDVHYHALVISDITEQRVQRERLERQAHFDELTRLPNRTRLSQLLEDAMLAADRDGYLLAVCYLDLDRFKPVNDRFGHAAGDRLLAELAGRLRNALRSREHWTDAAARLGGDEFVLLLRASTIEEARLAVERVLRVVSQPYVIDPEQDAVQITASMGATVYPIDRSDADTLLRHADHAMYGAKQSGRNGYLFFDPEHRRRTEERVMAIGRVQEALDLSEFVLYYQPKVDMKSGRVLGFEALLRWDHPQQGLIAPLQFLPLIENTGLSTRVGDWVFARAMEHLSQWRKQGLDISVSVNVSPRHLQEPDFAQRLSELLARHTDPLARFIELEILETAAHADIEATSALLVRCRALGVRFALDDFGTGYSTLTYLKRLPVDVLKIDRSFVSHMLDDAQDRAIVEGVIGLARTFGCTVVAEGVESPAQARALLEMGCDIGQGTGIAAPMPAALVANWVRYWRGMFALGPASGAIVEGARLGR
jgi:diguanylate cyclase (GGDEF)-like protein/PAS domain S-box-containing protein